MGTRRSSTRAILTTPTTAISTARTRATIGEDRLTSATRPKSSAWSKFHRAGWVYEEKTDGWRIVAYKDGERVRLLSRNGVDHTGRFRDVAVAVARLKPKTLLLDGEVAIFDQQLRSRSDWPASHPTKSPRRQC